MLQCSAEDLQLAEEWLGFSLRRLEFIRTAQSPEEARTLLLSVQQDIRARWKQIALELHPDRTGNDGEKTRVFRALSNVVDEIERQEVSVRSSLAKNVRRSGRSLGKITIRVNVKEA